MTETMNQYRQGDVLCQQIDKLPEGVEEKKNEGPMLVLRYGSATGHSHAFRSEDAREWVKGSERYIEILNDQAPLLHEEHSTIPFAKGFYQVVQQREWVSSQFRTVID